MSEAQDTEERPCLHCMMVELIENFFAEYPAASGEPDTIDTDEVIIALAKTGRLDVRPEQYGSPTDNRNLDAPNYGIRCRVSSRGRIRCGHLCCTALAAKEVGIAAERRNRPARRAMFALDHVWTVPPKNFLTDDIGRAQMVLEVRSRA